MESFDDRAATWDDPKKKANAEQIATLIRKQIAGAGRLTTFESGCGTGLLSFALKNDFSNFFLTDVSAGMLAVLDKKIKTAGLQNMRYAQMDLTSGALPDQQYDVVYTMMALHHIHDTHQIIQQFYQILKPSGYLFIADLDTEDGSFHGKDATDVHLGFDRKELGDLTKHVGFQSVSFETAYELDHENKDGEKGIFPVFLMTARK